MSVAKEIEDATKLINAKLNAGKSLDHDDQMALLLISLLEEEGHDNK